MFVLKNKWWQAKYPITSTMVLKLLEHHKAQSLQPPYVSFIRYNYSKFAYKILEWNDTFY